MTYQKIKILLKCNDILDPMQWCLRFCLSVTIVAMVRVTSNKHLLADLARLFAQKQPKICVSEFNRIQIFTYVLVWGPVWKCCDSTAGLPVWMQFMQTDYLGVFCVVHGIQCRNYVGLLVWWSVGRAINMVPRSGTSSMCYNHYYLHLSLGILSMNRHVRYDVVKKKCYVSYTTLWISRIL